MRKIVRKETSAVEFMESALRKGWQCVARYESLIFFRDGIDKYFVAMKGAGSGIILFIGELSVEDLQLCSIIPMPSF